MAEQFLTGLVILHALSGAKSVSDITCVINHARTNITGDDNLYIGGYKSVDDILAIVTFGRTTDTGTGNGLPTSSTQEDHSYWGNQARILEMPQTGGLERMGAFYCQAQKDGVTERIPAIIMASNSVVTPQRFSQTVSVGDDVTLSVITDIVNTRWRLNGIELGTWDGQKSVPRSNVQVNHGGIYECHQVGNREEGRHAIFLLVVRACASRKWGIPACTNDCPVCFNGGICDERSGICVCAPGFTGINCETVHGSNRWGQDGTFRCKRDGNDPHSTACRGFLFCLPHPYGCSCAAGFHGIDCDQDCQQGTYGANCESECHCAEGVSCLPDTGECVGEQCHPDWLGVNCQEPGPVTDLMVSQTSSPYELSVSWLALIEGQCIAGEYIIRYTLINQDQCKEEIEETIQMETSDLMVVLDNLYPYSTYRVSISAVNSAGEGMTSSINQTTSIAEPSLAPTNVRDSDVGSTMLSMQWLEIQCGSRHGELSYIYRLQNTTDAVVRTGVSQSTSVTMSDLEPITRYTFQVAGVTETGSGPWSDPYDTATTRQEIKAPERLSDIDDANLTSTAFTTVRIRIPQSTDELVTGYQVGVQIKKMKPERQTSQFGHYYDSKEAYVTAELSKSDVIQSPVFLVGDGHIYGQYYNAPLKANQAYTLHVAFVIRINNTVFEAYWSEGTDIVLPSATCTSDSSKYCNIGSMTITAVLVTVIVVIVILVLIIGILSCILRAKNKQLNQQRQDKTKSTPSEELASTTGAPSQQIKMSLEGHVEYKPNSSEMGFQNRSVEQGDDYYDEIPVSEYTYADDSTLYSADGGKREKGGAYINDSVVAQHGPHNKLPPQEQRVI